MLEIYAPTVKYIKEPDNYIESDLSSIPIINSVIIESNIIGETLSESDGVDKLYSDTFPQTYPMIDKYQQREK